MTKLALSQDQEADQLISDSPLALVIGLVLDQQITLEKAFQGPLILEKRLGKALDAKSIASMQTAKLEELFSMKPALHRFPASMARRVQDLCITIVDDYQNDAQRIWTEANDAKDLFKRINSLPGFGDMKAKIFIALLGKQLALNLDNWMEVCKPFGDPGSYMSLADITDKESLAKVREFKAQMKAKAKATK